MKRSLLIAFITIIIAFSVPVSVFAADDNIYWGDTIPSGTVIEHDVILYGKNIQIDGTVKGNVLIIGNQVILNGDVDGSLVLIAQNASLGGNITGTVYAIALTLDLPNQSLLERDLWIASVSITSGSKSYIGRHLYALGLDAGLNGQIGGELHTSLGPIQLYNGLMRFLGFEELTVKLYFGDSTSSSLPPGTIPIRHFRLQLLESQSTFEWEGWGFGVLRLWAVLFIFGMMGLWLLSKPLNQTSNFLSKHPWNSIGIGFLVLVVSLNLFVVGLLLFVLIFSIGLGLNFLGLWQITLAIWTIAFSGLIISLVALGLFISIGSKFIVIYAFCSLILRVFTPRDNILLTITSLLLGTMIYSLLRSIPYAGWFLDLLLISAGMGATWLTIRNTKQARFKSEELISKKTRIKT